MTTKIAVTGKANDGTIVKRSVPVEVATVQPLKGVAGHYVIAEAIPLSSFKPGSYTITVNMKDLPLDKSYELAESFRIVE
jgi:hypothetical protein